MPQSCIPAPWGAAEGKGIRCSHGCPFGPVKPKLRGKEWGSGLISSHPSSWGLCDAHGVCVLQKERGLQGKGNCSAIMTFYSIVFVYLYIPTRQCSIEFNMLCEGIIFVCFTSRSQMPRIVQFSSVAQSCPTLCDPVDCSMPGLPVHHQLLELTQTHVH